MPGQVTVKFDLTELRRAQRKFPDVVGAALKRWLQRSTRLVKGTTQDFTPVDTGLLRSKWDARFQSARNPKWGSVYNPIHYAVPLEESDKSPRGVGRIPFLAPAIDASIGRIRNFVKTMKNEIERGMKR